MKNKITSILILSLFICICSGKAFSYSGEHGGYAVFQNKTGHNLTIKYDNTNAYSQFDGSDSIHIDYNGSHHGKETFTLPPDSYFSLHWDNNYAGSGDEEVGQGLLKIDDNINNLVFSLKRNQSSGFSISGDDNVGMNNYILTDINGSVVTDYMETGSSNSVGEAYQVQIKHYTANVSSLP